MRAAAASWDRFWFAPTSTSPLALIRVAFGVIVIAWALGLAPDLLTFFSAGGMLRTQPLGGTAQWTVLALLPSDEAVSALFALLLLAASCLVLGFHTRLASTIVFVVVISFERRNPFIFNAGDGLIRIMAFYLMLAPAGESFSLDRWRRAKDRFWEFPVRPVWPLRLMQVQLSAIYLSAVWEKVRGEPWNDGTAFTYALRYDLLHRFPVPAWLTDTTILVNLATYGTLATELALGVLVWNRKARPWVLAAGVFLHLSVDYSIRIGFFSVTMLALYLAFAPPDFADRLLIRLRDRRRRKSSPHPLQPSRRYVG